jgi:hypothetical protein
MALFMLVNVDFTSISNKPALLTPDGAGAIRNCDLNFAELFWQVWEELGYQLPTDIEHCYIFELMTKQNQIISIPDRNRLVLHSARNIKVLFAESGEDYHC